MFQPTTWPLPNREQSARGTGHQGDVLRTAADLKQMDVTKILWPEVKEHGYNCCIIVLLKNMGLHVT